MNAIAGTFRAAVPIQSLADEPHIEAVANDIHTWVHEAGNPYFDWLFGDADVAARIVASRMTCARSELFVGNAEVLEDCSGTAIGGIITMTGSELAQRRKVDAIAYLHSVRRSARTALAARIRESREIFAPIQPGEFYLSRVGLRRDARGRGYGRTLVQRFLAVGASRGLHRYALHVSESNIGAVRLYRSLGFQVCARSEVSGTGMTYLAMRLEWPPSEGACRGYPEAAADLVGESIVPRRIGQAAVAMHESGSRPIGNLGDA